MLDFPNSVEALNILLRSSKGQNGGSACQMAASRETGTISLNEPAQGIQ
jgi:hypothetical protein